jgi:4-hydroxybenzoate polyprenyltransferase
LYVVTTIIGLIVALCINPVAFIISLTLWFLGFLYNWKLKAAGLWGNLIVSTNVAMTFILGGVSVGQAVSPMVLIFGFIAFFFDLAEEIAGDAMDIGIIFFIIKLLKSHTSLEGRNAMRSLYISATIGLVAIILSRFVR